MAKRLQIAFHNDVPGERQESRCGELRAPVASYGFGHDLNMERINRADLPYRNDRLTVCHS